jgi:sarcosine oxidase, subunit delta
MRAPLRAWRTEYEAAVLRIPCPYCGTRDEPEFVFGGPAHVTRPDFQVNDETWTTYLFTRENRAGIQCERWQHLYGCGRWFNIVRDTLTHQIVKAYSMGAPRPSVAETP